MEYHFTDSFFLIYFEFKILTATYQNFDILAIDLTSFQKNQKTGASRYYRLH
jgi:hypothetical protein